jgi:hypothetical protein
MFKGEGEDGLEDASGDDVDAFAHSCRVWRAEERLWGRRVI